MANQNPFSLDYNNPLLQQPSQPAAQTPAPQQQPQQKQGFLEKYDILPTVGAVGGGILGGLLGGGVGAVPGAAAGGGLGETLEQFITGHHNLKGIAGETALGGIGEGVVGPLLGRLLGVGGKTAAKAGVNAVEDTAAQAVEHGIAPTAPQYVKDAVTAPLAAKLGAKGITSELSYPSAKLAAKFSNEPAWVEVLQHNPPVTGLPTWLAKSQKVLEDTLQQATGSIKTPVDFSPALKTARETLESSNLVTDKKSINKALANISTIISKSGGALEAVRGLDNEARAILEQAGGGNFIERMLSATNPKKVELQGIAHAYSDAADSLLTQISKQGSAEKVLKSPGLNKFLDQAAAISPRLEQQLAKVLNEGNVGDLRSLQAPFVNASKQLIASKAASSGASNAGLNRLLRSGIGGAAGFGVAGIPGAVAGAVAGPSIEAGIEAARLPLSMATAKGLQGVSNVAGGIGKAAPAVGSGIAQGLTRLGAGAASLGGGGSAPSLDQSQAPQQPQISNAQQANPSASQNPYPIANYVADISRDPKNASIYKAIYDAYQTQFATATPKNLSTTAAQNINLAQNGLTDLKNLKDILGTDSNVLLKELIPGQVLSRQYDSTAKRVAEALVRIESGANAPAAEVKRYQDEYIPKFGDSQKVINSKLTAIQTKLAGALQLQSSTAGAPDSSGLLQMLGIQ